MPASFYIRQAGVSADGPIPDVKQVLGYGVLGLVQELCSGLLRAELLLVDASTKSDIYALSEDALVDFVARSISLPALKCAAIHFPRTVLGRGTVQLKSAGLVDAWLGVPQPAGAEAALESRFRLFSERVIKKANWGAAGHKIRPDASMFRMDFPPQQESVLLDLTKACGKGWATHTLTRQLRERLDRYNTGIDAEGDELSPVLKLWIAKLCYYPADRDDEGGQRAALISMIRATSYRARIPNFELAHLQDAGMRHLSQNTYPTTK